MILRWCVARYGAIPKNPQAAEVAEKCYYELDLFHRWGAVERSRGMLTSRQIEEGLRSNWGGSPSPGAAFRMVRWYLNGLRRAYAGNDPVKRIEAYQWMLKTGEVETAEEKPVDPAMGRPSQ